MLILFDVDGTLIGANCTAALVRGMVAEGLVSRRTAAWVGLQRLLYDVKLRSYPALMSRVYGLLEGRDAARLEACAERVVRDTIVPSIYPRARARIDTHLDRGDRVVLASASPAVVVQRLARHVGVDDVIATGFERRGTSCGPLRPPAAYGEGKVEWARRAGLLDGGAPHVYTDHIEDWPLIAAAGFTTLVDPADRLVRRAQRQGIAHEVVRWRDG